MNDRFKFRFWDKEKNVMIYSKNGYYKGDCFNLPLADMFINSRFISMQCTGLKDFKNGTLIYEGDILKFRSGNKFRIGKLEVYKCEWLVSNSNFCQGAWCGGALINLYNTCEVIGNIYENPELIKE